jgi:hypothetical protein
MILRVRRLRWLRGGSNSPYLWIARGPHRSMCRVKWKSRIACRTVHRSTMYLLVRSGWRAAARVL